MNFSYFNYRVEIKNVKFTTEHGMVLPKTAIVTLMDQHQETLAIELYGHMETDEIYRLIDENEPVNLDQCYIRNFSLDVYRKTRKLDRRDVIAIPKLSARKAFFESQYETNFSQSRLEGGPISFEHTHFAKGAVTFNGSVFAGGVNFAYTFFRDGNLSFTNAIVETGDFIFKNAVFREGIKDFQYANFGKGSVNFTNTDFGAGEISFINTDFSEGDVSFKVARIRNGKVDFHFAKFGEGDISFERTEFGNCRVDFRKVEFNQGRVNFNRAQFGNGEVSFEGSGLTEGKFSFKRVSLGSGTLNFELAEFEGVDVFFDRTNFGTGAVSFHKSCFRSLSLKSCHLDHYFDLRVLKCQYLDLSDTIVRDILDLKPYDYDVEIKVLNLAGMRLLGTIYVDWKKNRVKKIIKSQSNTGYPEKAEQFRILKENFNQTGQYGDEDRSYVEFKRFEARARLDRSIKQSRLNALWQYPWHGFKWLVLDVAGLYATDPLRVLFSMIGWYVLFSLVYYVGYLADVSLIVSSTGYELEPLARSFYHSAITFLTIGYGDHFPTGVSRIVSSIEGFAGMFLMAYFTVSLVRKILR